MKRNKLLLATLFFFLLVNTGHFWEWRYGFLWLVLFIITIIGYIFFPVALLIQIYLIVKEKFKNRRRVILVAVLAIVLMLTYWKPTGLINFEQWEGKDLLVAEREGSANCFTKLKLKANNTFIERSICFGIGKISGSYQIKNDTIFFSNTHIEGDGKYYQFAVIKKSESQNKKIIGELVLYNEIADTNPHRLWIIKNELNK